MFAKSIGDDNIIEAGKLKEPVSSVISHIVTEDSLVRFQISSLEIRR